MILQKLHRGFWFFVHNAIAHPLLCFSNRRASWIGRFHDWTEFIPVAKFHDLPIEMQTGIWLQFISEQGWSIEISLPDYDLEEDILNILCLMHMEQTENTDSKEGGE